MSLKTFKMIKYFIISGTKNKIGFFEVGFWWLIGGSTKKNPPGFLGTNQVFWVRTRVCEP